jgi:hypothetical protein
LLPGETAQVAVGHGKTISGTVVTGGMAASIGAVVSAEARGCRFETWMAPHPSRNA